MACRRGLDAHCPSCHALERHRHQALWIKGNEGELRNKRILHFAPEGTLRKLYRPLASTYASANIAPGRADLVLNLERIDQPDGVVGCRGRQFTCWSMSTTARRSPKSIAFLAPGGFAILSFPIAPAFRRDLRETPPSSRRPIAICISGNPITCGTMAWTPATGSPRQASP